MATVRLEVMAWLSARLGPPGSGRLVLEEEIGDGETVQELLNRLGSKHPVFHEAIFDVATQELTGRVTLIHNGRLAELGGGLQARLRDGDSLLFIPAFAGGGSG